MAVVTLPAFPAGTGAALAPLLLDALAQGVRPVDLIAEAAAALPAPLQAPDATPSLATGASDIGRADAYTYTALSAVPRLVEALGPGAVHGVEVGDHAFSLQATYADPASGFAAVELHSLADDRTVFAIDSTNFASLPDVVADLNLAIPQAASPAFAAMVADATAAALATPGEVAFAGASLGGALSQVAGYETAAALLAAQPGLASAVTVFGIDSLGGRDAAEALNGGPLDPAVLAHLDALNIRTQGDVVSRVGSDLGDSLTFPALDAAGHPVALTPAQTHVNYVSLFTNLSSDALFDAGLRGDPGEIGGLTLLAKLAGPGAAEALADPALAAAFGPPAAPALPATGTLDTAAGSFDLDANGDGVVDLRLLLGDPLIA